MQFYPIADWDDAYTNADHIPDAAWLCQTLAQTGRRLSS